MNEKKIIPDSNRSNQKDKKTSYNEKNENSIVEKNKKLDPTRYGDWEVKGIAVDF